MTSRIIEEFFAWAPPTIFATILIVLYFATRTHEKPAASPGKTYACARCGRRGEQEQMIPVTEHAAVLWYCPACQEST